jgi:6-phosphogluconolactonase
MHHVTPGSGPRNLVFHPQFNVVYILNEINSTVLVCAYNPSDGVLGEELGTSPTLPNDFSGKNTCAAIRINKKGTRLYASNRGHNSITVWKIENEGRSIVLCQYVATKDCPRDFNFSPDEEMMIVGNQNTHSVIFFEIDEDGKLGEVLCEVSVGVPVALLPFSEEIHI